MTKKKIHVVVGFLIGLLITVVLIRTFTFDVRTDKGNACTDPQVENKGHSRIDLSKNQQILENFRQALRFKTISLDKHLYSTDELTKFRIFVEKNFIHIHTSPFVKYEVVANYSLLYTIQGLDPSLTPYMLASHFDVVPAPSDGWHLDPFAAEIKDDFIYARGTVDDKHGVMGILEALEHALKTGFKPQRTFYLAFGHDEEVRGLDGAYAIGQLLKSRQVKLEYLLDEGLMVTNGLVKGTDKPVAMIGVVEKGQAVVVLSVNGTPGHSSFPPFESSIGILSAAVNKIEITPHPNKFGSGAEKATFEHLAPELSLPYKILLSNLWLFKPLVGWFLSLKPNTNALVRTVSAVTRFDAGIKDNIVPAFAQAVVNYRIHPSESVKEVIGFCRKIIQDERVQLNVKYSMEASFTSPFGDDSFGYHTIKNSIQEVFENVIVVPGVMFANTDTRHYKELTKSIYRFSPGYLQPDMLSMIHGYNERISIWNYEKVINFYHHLILNSDKADLQPLNTHIEL